MRESGAFSRWSARLAPVVASAFLLFGCKQTVDANKKVKEANDAMDDANSLEREAVQAQVEAGSKFRTDLDSAVAAADRCVKKMQDAQTKVDSAAKLLKDASEMKLETEFTNYLSLMAKAYAKVSDSMAAEKSLCELIASKPTEDQYEEQLRKMQADAEARQKEATDYQDQAAQIRKDHPNKFD